MENYKIGYTFHPITNEFICEQTVWIESMTGEFPHADNVTFIKPPEVGENQKQVWAGKDWKIVPDYRGKVWFKQNGEMGGIIDFLGELNNQIIEEPPRCSFPESCEYDYIDKKWIVNLDDNFVRDSETGLIREKTKEELYDEGRLTLEEYNEYIRQTREIRFATETDKMGLMYLRGECTLEEWQSAMNKIREELPKK